MSTLLKLLLSLAIRRKLNIELIDSENLFISFKLQKNRPGRRQQTQSFEVGPASLDFDKDCNISKKMTIVCKKTFDQHLTSAAIKILRDEQQMIQ